MFLKKISAVTLMAALSAPVTGGQMSVAVPADPARGDAMAAAVRAAEHGGDHALAISEARRWLELYPNEPIVQAGIYLGMSASAGNAGQAAQSRDFRALSERLDPTLATRLALQRPQTRGAKRGAKADSFLAAMGVVLTTVTAIQQARQQVQEQRAQRAAMQQMLAFPQAPVGYPGYQAPPAGYQPMPGYAPQPGGAMPPVGSDQPQYLASGDPNLPPPGYAPAFVRGAAGPIKVIHDHAQLGDTAYFEKSCGALLTVSGTTLTFTPGGGEAPRVIPASQIRALRANAIVGKDIGAFHITTTQGLYLNLAPASGEAADGKATVDALRKQLHVVE